MDWERARKPEQKAIRRDAILNAARTLFSELAYEEISLNAIAREAGISKPNIYRYFSTREEIFLTIFGEELDDFVTGLVNRIRQIQASDPIDAICRAWTQVALTNRILLDLLPLLCISMEKNSSLEQLVNFKKFGNKKFNDLVVALEQIYPRLNTQQWATVMQCAFSLMSGLWPLTNPAEHVLEAFRHPEVNQQPWSFEPLMTGGLSALIHGSLPGKISVVINSDESPH